MRSRRTESRQRGQEPDAGYDRPCPGRGERRRSRHVGFGRRERDIPERPLTTLTALFEEARFSLHPIPDSAPSRALSELEDARVALAEIHPSVD
jgi:hypothetical protein